MKKKYNNPPCTCGGYLKYKWENREGLFYFNCKKCKTGYTFKTRSFNSLTEAVSIRPARSKRKVSKETLNNGTSVFTLQDIYDRCKNGSELAKELGVTEDKWIIDNSKASVWNNGKDVLKSIRFEARPRYPENPVIPVLQPLSFPHTRYNHRKIDKLKSVKTYCISDAHIGYNRNFQTGELTPYQRESVMKIHLQIMDVEKPDRVILQGDMLDFAEVSSKFIKKPEFYQTVQPAINYLGRYLQTIREILPEAEIIYFSGNHEERLLRFQYENMAFAYGLKGYNQERPLLSIENLLGLDDLGIAHVNYKDEYWITDKLRAIHGEFTRSATEINQNDISTVQGHLHTMQRMYKNKKSRYKRTPNVIVTNGCSCKLDGTVPAARVAANARRWWHNSAMLLNSALPNRFFDELGVPRLAP